MWKKESFSLNSEFQGENYIGIKERWGAEQV